MPKIETTIEAKDNSSGAFKSLTSSMLTAQGMFAIISGAAKKLGDFMQSGSESAAKQEKAEARLVSQLGSNIQSNIEYANQIEKTLNISDDLVLSTQSYAKSLGVQTSELQKTTDQAIGLSKAVGVDLNTAMKLTVNAQQGNYDILARSLPALKTATSETEKAAIVQKAYAEGLKMVSAEAQTNAGLQDSLNNNIGNIAESLFTAGNTIYSVFLPSLVESTSALTDMIESFRPSERFADIVAKIAAGFSVFKAVVGDVVKAVMVPLREGFEKIKDSFERLSSGLGDTNTKFSAFAVIGKGVSLVLGLAIQSVTLMRQSFIDLSTTIKEVGLTVAKFFIALVNPAKWGEFVDQVKKTGESVVTQFKNTFSNVSELVSGIAKGATEIFDINAINKKGKEYSDIAAKSYADARSRMAKEKDGADKDELDKEEEKNKLILDSNKQTAFSVSDVWRTQAQGIAESFQTAGNSVIAVTTNIFNGIKDNASNLASSIKTVADGISTAFENTFKLINDVVASSFEQQIEEATKYFDSYSERLESDYARRLELLENDGLTKQEKMSQELADLEASLAYATSLDEKKKIQEAISDKNKEIAIYKAKDEYDRKKEKSEEKLQKRKHQLEVQAFKAKQAMDIAQTIASMAMGIVSAWASGAAMVPLPVGMALAGVMTGIIATMGGIQLGVIASQKPPSFATGGVVPGNIPMGDNIPVMADSGEVIITKKKFDKLMNIVDSGEVNSGFTNYGTINIAANDPQEFFIELQRMELARL